MSISKPKKRMLIHTRNIRCRGYEREDGLWDIEGQVTDTKSYDFRNRDRGEITAGTPVHDMLVRLTINEKLVVKDAEAITLSSPFNICPNINGNISSLIGLRITKGWRDSVKRAIGGIKGCTHINQLLTGPIATTAYQAIVPRQERKNADKNTGPDKPSQRPALLNTCHAFDTTGQNVKGLWPQFYDGDD